MNFLSLPDTNSKNAEQMQALLEDLLLYIRTKEAEKKFKKTELTIIIRNVKKNLEELIRKKKAIIEVASLDKINIIQPQFQLLLQNLIINSLKFSKPRTAPRIKIKSKIVHGGKLNNLHLSGTRPSGSSLKEISHEKLLQKIDYCHITYTDNGIGFDPQYKERIFEMFQRLNSQEDFSGTGMGLAICKKIIEIHGGMITAKAKINKGARFDIYIPA